MKIPSLILKQLYTFGSLENTTDGYKFLLKNRLSDATVLSVQGVQVDDKAISPEELSFVFTDKGTLTMADFSEEAPIAFPLRAVFGVMVKGAELAKGMHRLQVTFTTEEFGEMNLKVKDSISEKKEGLLSIPYDKVDNFSENSIKERQKFIQDFSKEKVDHLFQYSFDPSILSGNIENFTGVAQVPIGFAGPLHVNGEYAKGDFIIPMATTEGTLVASYNRGMKVLNLCGGPIATVSQDRMQRAPVFVFENALEARNFKDWVEKSMEPIRDAAEATSSVAKLLDIDIYLAIKFAYLRFNYATGDAAGQNMVGRATFAACSWILENYKGINKFYLESNLATDKKASQINIMRTRGKRVTAEITLKREVLTQNMRVTPEQLFYHYNVSNVGSFLSGANNNGLHSPNGITAMFIATGQDVANVAESSAGILYTEITPEGDFYLALTIPSLIVATHGGGTSLPTQNESLRLLGCTGRGTVRKFAEIVASVALAGEISLASAISSLDWVSSHEKYGRNR